MLNHATDMVCQENENTYLETSYDVVLSEPQIRHALRSLVERVSCAHCLAHNNLMEREEETNGKINHIQRITVGGEREGAFLWADFNLVPVTEFPVNM